MRNLQGKLLVALVGIALFCWFIYSAFRTGVTLYMADSLVFIGLILATYFLYDSLRMTPFSFSVLILAFALHNAGVFGWYYQSPLPYVDPFWKEHVSAHPFQWDHITHVAGIFAITLVIFQFMSQFFKKSKVHNVILLVLIALAGMGIGAAIEHYEFFGFLTLGEGEGGLGKGGPGDFTGAWASSDWLNVMWDLLYNTLGAVLGVGVGYILYKNRKLSEKSKKPT